MIAVAVSGIERRADAVACCAALALVDRLGASAALVLLCEGADPKPALLASPAARRLEAAISAGLEGIGPAAARGHLCLVSVDSEAGAGLAVALGELVGAEIPVVASVAPARLGGWQRRITLIRADLPADRAVLTLLAGSIGEREGALRIDKRGPGRIGARRALAGLPPGRAPLARYQWLCRVP